MFRVRLWCCSGCGGGGRRHWIRTRHCLRVLRVGVCAVRLRAVDAEDSVADFVEVVPAAMLRPPWRSRPLATTKPRSAKTVQPVPASVPCQLLECRRRPGRAAHDVQRYLSTSRWPRGRPSNQHLHPRQKTDHPATNTPSRHPTSSQHATLNTTPPALSGSISNAGVPATTTTACNPQPHSDINAQALNVHRRLVRFEPI